MQEGSVVWTGMRSRCRQRFWLKLRRGRASQLAGQTLLGKMERGFPSEPLIRANLWQWLEALFRAAMTVLLTMEAVLNQAQDHQDIGGDVEGAAAAGPWAGWPRAIMHAPVSSVAIAADAAAAYGQP